MALLLLSGFALATGATGAALAQSTPPARTIPGDPHAAFVAEASKRFGIPAHWIIVVKRIESAGDERAVSSAGALGLMQVMPDTWAALRVRYGLGRDPYDPRDNILAGVAYLREMFDRYRNVQAMLAAYNAGPARYDDYLQTDRALPPETRVYVAFLAPQLGATSPSSTPSIAPTPPLDWREAPLFVVRSADRIRPDGIRSTRAQAARPFVVQALAAAKKAGGGVSRSGRVTSGNGSRFGHGQRATIQANRLITARSRGAVIKARVVRHSARAAPLGTHLDYLRRGGVTHDGEKARLFGPEEEEADGRAIAEHCEDDRHHLRCIVSPDDAAERSGMTGTVRH